MQELKLSYIRFPDLKFKVSDGSKIRGYFGHLFKEHSTLLHNHYEDGNSIYQYPLVQYKVIDTIPMLIGLNEGANLLANLFLHIRSIEIDNIQYNIHSKDITHHIVDYGVIDSALFHYKFQTKWFALSHQNHLEYLNQSVNNKTKFLEKILVGNILAMFKGVSYFEEQQIILKILTYKEKESNFKNNRIMVFDSEFVTNVRLPNYIGLGKSVSRGYGAIKIL